MKNFQKIALGLMVALMAIGFSAFKSSNESNKIRETVYFTTTPTTINGDPAWNLGTSDPECEGGSNPCQVTYLGEGTPISPVKLSDLQNTELYRIDSRKP